MYLKIKIIFRYNFWSFTFWTSVSFPINILMLFPIICIWKRLKLVSDQGTSVWLCNNGSSLVREVALFEREGLWSPVVGISFFSVVLSQLSAQLVKEGRKWVSRAIHICLLLTIGLLFSLSYCEQFEGRDKVIWIIAAPMVLCLCLSA